MSRGKIVRTVDTTQTQQLGANEVYIFITPHPLPPKTDMSNQAEERLGKDAHIHKKRFMISQATRIGKKPKTQHKQLTKKKCMQISAPNPFGVNGLGRPASVSANGVLFLY